MELYIKKEELLKEKNKFWKSAHRAFPDVNCKCLKGDYWPVRCKECGANRTKSNWIKKS